MDIMGMTQTLGESAPLLLSGFLTAEARLAMATLGIYAFSLAIYAVFIFKFYKFLAKKDIFHLELEKYSRSEHPGAKKFFAVISYLFKYLFIFPVVVFIWFTFIGLLLLFLSRGGNVQHTLLIAISLVGAVRICAYYTEELSRDVAKMLPFALLGVYIVDASYFNFANSVATLYTVPQHTWLLFYYFVFIILLEFFLRMVSGIKSRLSKGDEPVKPEPQNAEKQRTEV